MPNLRGQLQQVLAPYPAPVCAAVMASELRVLIVGTPDAIADSEVATEALEALRVELNNGL